MTLGFSSISESPISASPELAIAYAQPSNGVLNFTGFSPSLFLQIYIRPNTGAIFIPANSNIQPTISASIVLVGQPVIVFQPQPVIFAEAVISGGSVALAPGEIWNFYKPVANTPHYLTPYQFNKKVKARHVKIEVTVNGETTEKYMVITLPKTPILLQKIDVRVSKYAVTFSQIHVVHGVRIATIKESAIANYIPPKITFESSRLNQ